jgi:hypothetical protein
LSFFSRRIPGLLSSSSLFLHHLCVRLVESLFRSRTSPPRLCDFRKHHLCCFLPSSRCSRSCFEKSISTKKTPQSGIAPRQLQTENPFSSQLFALPNSRDPYPTPRLLNGPRVCLFVWSISRSLFFCRSWSGHLRFSCLFTSSCDGIFLGRIERFPRPSAQVQLIASK